MNLKTFRPRYFVRRLKQIYFERRHPDCPWLTESAILLLDNWLKPSDIGLEWGSGRSTCWLAKRVFRLTSVEDNEQWYNRVREKIISEHLESKVDYRYIACQLTEQSEPESHIYSDIAQEFPDESLDFALVGGNIRLACTRVVIPKIKTGGVLILDNANRYIPNPFLGGFSTIHEPCSQPRTPAWGEIQDMLKDWRWINTTDGIWDTRFWIKPYEK